MARSDAMKALPEAINALPEPGAARLSFPMRAARARKRAGRIAIAALNDTIAMLNAAAQPIDRIEL